MAGLLAAVLVPVAPQRPAAPAALRGPPLAVGKLWQRQAAAAGWLQLSWQKAKTYRFPPFTLVIDAGLPRSCLYRSLAWRPRLDPGC